MQRALILISASLLVQSIAWAQDPAPAPPPAPPVSPCTLETGPARDFDFWIGEWQVFNPQTDQLLGTNRITRREAGCLIVEDWEGARGSTGMSMNFYDAELEKWRQVWQSAQILVELAGGLDDEGRMVMEGHVHYHAQDQRRPFRGRWTPNEDGTVLQEFWEQRDTPAWTPWFIGLYRPADE